MFRLDFAISTSRCFENPSLFYSPNSLNIFEQGVSWGSHHVVLFYFWFSISFKVVLN